MGIRGCCPLHDRLFGEENCREFDRKFEIVKIRRRAVIDHTGLEDFYCIIIIFKNFRGVLASLFSSINGWEFLAAAKRQKPRTNNTSRENNKSTLKR